MAVQTATTTVQGFDWDKGITTKCQRHGLALDEIEGLFRQPLLVLPDKPHASGERRFRAIGITTNNRFALVVFTVRQRSNRKLIRAISARYMHKKEVASYEAAYPELRDR